MPRRESLTVFLFGLTASFAEGWSPSADLRTLMGGFPASAPGGTRFAESGRAAAGIARWPVVRRDESTAPSWDAAARVLFAGDVRLYNRPELAGALGVAAGPDGCSDIELARLAYLRWGYDSPRHLVGDFAFAAWDEAAATLFAARDHLGVRPLYFTTTERGISLASDVRQLLRLFDQPRARVSPLRVLDGLLKRISDPRLTFFDGIVRLRAGHTLVIRAGQASERPYWEPPLVPDRGASYEENCAELRALFRRAVRDRLETEHPIVAHSSGGFDSSTIVMAANEVYRDEPGRPPLVMASAEARGFASDESHYMDAVAAAVSFEGVRWQALAPMPVAFPGVFEASPLLRWGLAGGPRRDLELAQERGARVLLSGLIGDDVWHATGVLRDFFRHGRLAPIARHFVRAGLKPSSLRRLWDATLGLLPPRTAWLAGLRHERLPLTPPAWMGPALRGLYPPGPEPFDLPRVAWPAHVTCGIWSQLTHPYAALVVESVVEYGIDAGIEVRLPHADVRLIGHVLRMPWQQRDPRGHHRRTGRDALGPMLPAAFAGRVAQRPWTPVWNANALRAIRALAPVIREGPWLTAAFVDCDFARRKLTEVLGSTGDAPPEAPAGELSLLLDMGTLEAWFRQLSG